MKTWDLTPIYPSLESEAFQNDTVKLKALVEDMNVTVDAMITDHENETEKLENYIRRLQELTLLSRKMSGYCSLRVKSNTNDDAAARAEEMLQMIMNGSVSAETKASAWIAGCDLDACAQASPLLKEHEFILKEIRDSMAHQLSDKEELIVASLRQTGSDAWMRLKNQVIGAHTVEIVENGEKKELPLTVVLNMAYHPDKEVRKAAYEAEIASYKKDESIIAACLNGIKGEVLNIASIRGYASPLEMTLVNSRMDEETLDAMLSAIREYLPAFRKYLRTKAEYLGYANGLPFYELYAPVSTASKTYTYEAACAFIRKHFKAFDEDLFRMADRAINENWIDVDSRPGKVGGAFCASVPSLKQSRVLLNFSNSFKSVVTMAHELGHAFHNDCAKNESILNLGSPMQLAETASTFNETMVKKAAIASMEKDEALAVLESEVCGCNQVIVDIYSRYLFETALFEARKGGAVSAKELCEMMNKAQEESYGDGLDPEYRHPYMWTWKPHYYYASRNFYNFPYAFGQLFAKGLYAKYAEQGEAFIPVYKKLLATTGRMSIYDCCMSVGIDVHDINFWRASLEMCKEDIDRFCELVKE